jgi:integrase
MSAKKASDLEQKGQLIQRASGWYGRFYVTVDGERVRVCRALGTTNKAVARAKLRRLVAEQDVQRISAQRSETFEEAGRRVVELQKAAGMATWKERLHRLEEFVFPALGAMQPVDIRAAHVRSVLESARDLGKARQTLIHIKNDISAVLGDLWRSDLLNENVTARVKAPEAHEEPTRRAKKERAVLTDEELMTYLSWEHPDEHQRMAVLERQTMACVARMFGGLRTSDLHTMTWDAFELPRLLDDGASAGGFESGIVPRKKGSRLAKGGRPQRLMVPEMLRPILRDWWERHGRPSAGLVFPARRGAKAGVGARSGVSHADAFRRDLRRAFGIEEQVPSDRERPGRGPSGALVWRPVEGRELTARERELFEETDYTLPVDFHSWRRAFNQALAEAGVNAQQAQALAGHASLDAHARYLANTSKTREIPAAALPRLGVGHSECPQSAHGEVEAGVFSAPDTIRTCDLRLRKPLLYPTELRRRGPADCTARAV